ncbi:hypothetical protein [Clostridium sp. YIM B02506]|jgi:hypothetical protein|uniref:hypothetical protein n=1 Tax=Clostridium sp. YIM B02506 TaxID=2910680 RepID=UPI001EEDE328|nr:hypothetical protein [Clostridium sp. YIM B02506]
MKINKTIILLATLGVLFLILIGKIDIGVLSKDNLEKDARKSHKIQEDWITASSINKDIGAFLFYDKDLSNYTFSIYTKREGLSFGYFFRYGGALPEVSEGIDRFDYPGKGSVLLSLNKRSISKIELGNGLEPKDVIDVDSSKPFSIIIPDNVGQIRIYDTNGELIPKKDI